jgi:hypothetical protein
MFLERVLVTPNPSIICSLEMDVIDMKVDVSRPPSNILGFESENFRGKRRKIPSTTLM